MAIVDDDVRRVRDETDIVRLITQHTQLKKVGRQWSGLCPFHSEKTPSFSVNQDKGVYYCFGCQAQGDAIEFVRHMEGFDFVGAVEVLAARSGITLRYTEKEEGRSRSRRKELSELVARAAAFYHERLMDQSDPTVRPARDYLRSRGYDGEVARNFNIGWAPDAWDSLATYLKVPDGDLVAAGLGGLNRNGGQYDFFRSRIVFPIFDERGDAVGFGGRKLPDAEGPKYKNTSDRAEIYTKSSVLYGLHWAKTEAGRMDELVVCEGYTDVIGCHMAGVERSVATCGTALTPEHARKMARFVKRVVLAFDSDGPGQAAAERVYGWESEFGLQFAVADLPIGSDPGDLARSDPQGLRQAISEARPYLEFRVDRVLAAADTGSFEGRARVATEAMALVAEHPAELVRDQYVMRIADRCLVSADEVRRLAKAAKTKPSNTASDSDGLSADRVAGSSTPRRFLVEHQALRLLIHRRDALAAWLDPVLFVDPVTKAAYCALTEVGELHGARAIVDDEAADLLGRLAVDDATDDDPNGVLCRLLALAAERTAVELEARARGSGDLESYQPSIAFLRHQVIDLRESVTDLIQVKPLLQWLIEYNDRGDDG
ncbi:MAG: DNA primase [Actinomycetota bacterium]|nr:DNA primase [Actinomycetota bacterium]